jgi:hypothetical protein
MIFTGQMIENRYLQTLESVSCIDYELTTTDY